MKFRVITGAASALLLFGIAGCGSASASSTTSKAPPTITAAYSGTLDTLDPQTTGAALTGVILANIGSTLVVLNPKTLQVTPYLATSWTISNHGLVYTFDLRKGVTFQDGTPFNAQAMAFTLERAMNPATHAKAAGAAVAPIKSVKVLGTYKLQITLKYPFSAFLSTSLASPNLMAISPTAVRKEGANFANDPIGTGPLEVKSYVPGKSLTLVRFSKYHWAPSFYSNKGPVLFKKLVIDFVPNMETIAAGLTSGEIDSGYMMPYPIAKQFAHNPKFTISKYLHPGLSQYVIFNFNNPILKQLAVRQAVNYALNRHLMVKVAINGQGVPAYSPLAPSIPGYWSKSPQVGYHYDVAKAKSLLRKAGYTMGSNGYLQKGGHELKFVLDTATAPPNWVTTAEIVKSELKAVGIDVSINTMPVGTLLSTMFAGNFQMGMMGYSYFDPDILYALYDSKNIGGLDMSQYNNSYVNGLLVAGREATSPTARYAIYHKVQKYLIQQAVVAPLYVGYDLSVLKKIPGFHIINEQLMVQDIR